MLGSKSTRMWLAGCLMAGKVFYDEYNGKSLIKSGAQTIRTYIGGELSVFAAAKTNFVPTYPLPQFAEYAGHLGCSKPPKRRRLFIAHMFGGSTIKTINSHQQHLCHFKIDPKADFVYCPAFCYIEHVKNTFPKCVEIGAQNIYPQETGNFTGEVSLPMVKDLGATYILVGTTHRRVFLGETDKFIRAKVHQALANGMKCIIFLANTTGDCDDCSTEACVTKQLDAVMPVIGHDDWPRVSFACEPIFCESEDDNHAEHTFKTIQAAQKMCKLVRDKVADRVGDEIAQRLRIVYSGNLCHGSAPMFMTQEDIDGAVFCPRNESECFINIVNSGLLVDRREELQAKKNK